MNLIDYTKKPKEKKHSYNYISDIIKIFNNNMFEYVPPQGLDKMQVEESLHNGLACLYKCPVTTSVNYGKWCCTPAYPASVITNNKTFKKCTTFGSDYGVELDVDEDCILLYNNSIKTNDALIEKYSDLIGEIDTTIYSIVKWCRLTPIPKVRTDEDIIKYKMVMDSVLNGNLVNVINDNSDLLSDSGKQDERLLKLTDPESANKLHFLSEFRQETIKRLSNLYGIPLQMSAKNAQIISDELHGMDIFSVYLLIDRYNARKESFERAEKFTGHKWEFDFSEITKHTLNDIFNHDNREDETDANANNNGS